MKIMQLFVAAGLAVTALAGTAAEARDWNHNGRADRYDRYDRYDRHHGRGWSGNDRRWNRDRHHRVHCRTEWRHHHRVRVCR